MTYSLQLVRDGHPRYPFCVRWKEGGKWRKKWFLTERAARGFMAGKKVELLNAAPVEAPISAGERRAVMAARAAGVDLEAAVARFLESARERGASVLVTEMARERVLWAEREGKSAAYLRSMGRFFERVGREWEGVLAAEVSARMVGDFLYGLGVAPGSVRHYRLLLLGLFGFGVRMGYLSENPVGKVRPPVVKAGRVGILTPAEVARVLGACDGEILPAMAISFFAGLRNMEVRRLAWGEVNLERQVIEVAAAKSKTAQRRIVRVEPVLARWLAGRVKCAGPVWPVNGDRLWDGALVGAGFRGRWGKAGLPWPKNAPRHSFASYHLAFFMDAARTALELGHMSTALLFEHYREVVTREAAAEFWALPKEPHFSPHT